MQQPVHWSPTSLLRESARSTIKIVLREIIGCRDVIGSHVGKTTKTSMLIASDVLSISTTSANTLEKQYFAPFLNIGWVGGRSHYTQVIDTRQCQAKHVLQR